MKTLALITILFTLSVNADTLEESRDNKIKVSHDLQLKQEKEILSQREKAIIKRNSLLKERKGILFDRATKSKEREKKILAAN